MAMTPSVLGDIPAGSRVYLDTNIWIYALEGFADFAVELTALFARFDAGELTAVTSELTLAEVLVKPLQSHQAALQQVYLDALQDGTGLSMVPVSRAVLLEAARLRASHHNLKLPDAIHAATALAFDAPSFITNDARFGTVSALKAIVLHAR